MNAATSAVSGAASASLRTAGSSANSGLGRTDVKTG